MSKIKTETFDALVENVDEYISAILDDNQSYKLKDIKMTYTNRYSQRVIVMVILEK